MTRQLKKEPLKLVIIGNGVASRTLLSMIMKKLRATEKNVLQEQLHSLHVFEGPKTPSTSSHIPPMYTGLWSPATHLLKSRLRIPTSTIESEGCAVLESGYRDQMGAWLMKPTKGMKSFPDRPSLLFFENKRLLDLLCKEEEIDSLIQSDSRVQIHRGVEVSKIFHRQDRTYISTSDNQNIETNLIVAADGMLSKTKEMVHGVKMDDFLTHRGYRVYRGVCPATVLSSSSSSALDPAIAFQTWGPSARFAIIPINNYRDVAWFAAISSPPIKASDHFKTSVSSPLFNGGRLASLQELQKLTSLFASWHSPIPDILQYSSEEATQERSGVVVNEAYALKTITEGMSVVSKAARSIVMFLGDAAFTLDPILAQGGGVAIEEGVEAFDVIMDILTDPQEKNRYYYPHDFETTRMERIRKLHRISNIAQTIGHMESPSLCRVRDGLLHAMPASLKGAVFDDIINYVDQRKNENRY